MLTIAGGSTPGRREPDAGRCHLPDPLPWRPHLWSAGPFADAGGAGPHKAACVAGSGGPAGYLGGCAGTDRPAALSGKAAGAYAGPAAGAGCAERGLACRCAAGAICPPAPGHKPWLPAGAAPALRPRDATSALPAQEAQARQWGHSTFGQSAALAAQAGAKRLWLTHYSPMITDPEEYAEQAQGIFPAAECGFDGKSITLQYEEAQP